MRIFSILILFVLLFAKEPILWTRFASGFDMTNSVIGGYGMILNANSANPDNTLFSSAYYVSSADYAATCAYYPSIVLYSNGCFCFWFKSDNWTLSGTDNSTGQGNTFLMPSYFPPYTTYTYIDLEGGLSWDTYYPAFDRLTATTCSFNSNEWHHYACAWDGVNKFFLFDGEVVASSGGSGFTPTNEYTIHNISVGAADTTGYSGWGWYSGFTLYDYCKTNFEDRYDERNSLNDWIY